MAFRVRAKEDSEWSVFDLSKKKVQLKGVLASKFNNESSSLEWFASIESYRRLDACLIEVEVMDHHLTLVFDVSNPRVQRVFGAYCRLLMERREVVEAVMMARPDPRYQAGKLI